MTTPKTSGPEPSTLSEALVAAERRFDEHGHELIPLSDLQLAQLKADLNIARVAHMDKPGSNKQMSYMQGYDIKAMLTRVFGFGGWSAEVVQAQVLKINDYQKTGGGTGIEVTAQATMRLHIHQLGATYAEVAIAGQKGSQLGEVADFAMKTAETDALKRAATNLGTQYGLSLYNAGSTQDIIGSVLAPGQRQIDQDAAKLRRRAEQLDTEAEMIRLGEQLQITAADIQAKADAANTADEDTAAIAGGERAPEDVPESIDQAAAAAAGGELAAGFAGQAPQ